jgi:ketosteroid isomerase-like protein
MLAPMMTTNDLHAFFERGWNRHDVDLLMTFMAEDCVFESTEGPETCGTRHAGRERGRRAFAPMFGGVSRRALRGGTPPRRGRPRPLGVALHRHDRGGTGPV